MAQARSTHSYRSEINEAYLAHAREAAFAVVRDRNRINVIANVFLYIAFVAVTSIRARYPALATGFGIGIISLQLARFGVSYEWNRSLAKNPQLRRRLLTLGSALNFSLWGLLCAWTVARFELGWTSFFILILTLGLGAISVPTNAPSRTMTRVTLLPLFIPTIMANLVWVSGLRGWALGIFGIIFFLGLYYQARVQHREYWTGVRNQSRLQAVIDAVPGTLAWVTRDLKYAGVNERMARVWRRLPGEFVGQKMGFIEPRSGTAEVMRQFFDDDSRGSFEREIPIPIDGRKRQYFLVAQKFNHATEAVVLGLDITDLKAALTELTERREQSLRSAGLAGLGEITGGLAHEIVSPVDAIRRAASDIRAGKDQAAALEQLDKNSERIWYMTRLIERLSQDRLTGTIDFVPVREIIEDATLLFQNRYRVAGVELRVGSIARDLQVEAHLSELLQVFSVLFKNALDALAGQSERWVQVDAERREGTVRILVTDSGKGIAPQVRARLFQPLFTTKESGKATGVGLSLSREILERHHGSIEVDADCPNTRFVVTLPLI